MTDTPQRGGGTRISGGGTVAAAMGIMSVAAYGFTILAARILGTQPYGAFAALMGLLLVVNVLSLGLQATAARRISASPGHAAEVERVILRVSYRAGLALTVLCLVLSPLIDVVLRLDSLPTAMLVGLAALPLTVMGGQAGILQGERRWRPLAAIYLASGLGRLVVGVALIAWHPTEFAAMLGVAIGAYVPVVIGWWALHRRNTDDRPVATESFDGGVIIEAVHNSHALLAFFALSNIDVIMARAVLDGHQAGLYAAGLIMVKAVLFLPQFVVVIAFPGMASSKERNAHLPALAAIAGLGLAATAVAALLPGFALSFVGGQAYEEIRGYIWAFAAVGTVLSMLQLMVYEGVARQLRSAVAVLWTASLILAGCALLVSTQLQLLATVAVVDVAALVVLAVFTARRRHRSDGQPLEDPPGDVSETRHDHA